MNYKNVSSIYNPNKKVEDVFNYSSKSSIFDVKKSNHDKYEPSQTVRRIDIRNLQKDILQIEEAQMQNKLQFIDYIDIFFYGIMLCKLKIKNKFIGLLWVDILDVMQLFEMDKELYLKRIELYHIIEESPNFWFDLIHFKDNNNNNNVLIKFIHNELNKNKILENEINFIHFPTIKKCFSALKNLQFFDGLYLHIGYIDILMFGYEFYNSKNNFKLNNNISPDFNAERWINFLTFVDMLKNFQIEKGKPVEESFKIGIYQNILIDLMKALEVQLQKTVFVINDSITPINYESVEINKDSEKKKNGFKEDCSICYDDLGQSKINFEEIWFLQKCHHCFHKICLYNYIKSQIDELQIPINCPEAGCKSQLMNDDIIENTDETYKNKYDEFSFKKYIEKHLDEYSLCPTPNCPFVFIFNPELTEFTCNSCKKKYCLNCKVEYHVGQNCKEYQISQKFDEKDEMFMKYVAGQKFKQCSKCKFWVEKNQGCDHMTCRCGYQFHYICGGPHQSCGCVLK